MTVHWPFFLYMFANRRMESPKRRGIVQETVGRA